MTKQGKKKAAGASAGKGKTGGPKPIWSDRAAINSKKIGRPRDYHTVEAKLEARRKFKGNQQGGGE